jgi:hypothetical protein
MASSRRTSFVVRVVEDGQGGLSGVVERVATGAKETFAGTEAIGHVIRQMLRRERAQPGPESRREPEGS